MDRSGLHDFARRTLLTIERRSVASEIKFPLDQIVGEFKLDEAERDLLLYLLMKELREDVPQVSEVTKFLTIEPFGRIAVRKQLEPTGKLRANRIIEIERDSQVLHRWLDVTVSSAIAARLLNANPTLVDDRLQQILINQSIFKTEKATQTLDDVVLPAPLQRTLMTGIRRYEAGVDSTLQIWRVERSFVPDKPADLDEAPLLILLSGPSGTGKTFTAGAIANYLGKELLTTDISKLLSCYVGESEQNVRKMLDVQGEIVRKCPNPPVFFLNECDQFLQNRGSVDYAADRMYNQMQNLLLEGFEKMRGVLIATTNLMDNIDKAFSRRFHLKLEIGKPDLLCRKKLWEKHLLPTIPRANDVETDKLAALYEFTGGQIAVIVRNAAVEAAVRGDIVHMSDLQASAEVEYSGAMANATSFRGPLGFVNSSNEGILMADDDMDVVEDTNTPPQYLSKSKLMALHQCPLRLWNEVHCRDKAQVPSPQARFLFDSGTAVGELARGLYPSGKLIQAEYWDHERASRDTMEAIAVLSVSAVFEPAFEYRRTKVRCDLVARTGNSWELWEVKSVRNPQDKHVLDVAIQAYVMRKSLESVGQSCDFGSIGVVHLNGTYVYNGKAYQLERLFKKHECLDAAWDLEDVVDDMITEGLRIIDSQTPPDIEPGDHCWTPYECPFLGSTCAIPKPHELSLVPGIGPARLQKLIDQGVESLEEFATQNLARSGAQKRMVRSLQTGECVVEPGLANALAGIRFPRYHLDFETFAPILPRYAGTSPIQALPFQFSVHIEHSVEKPAKHEGYLHAEDTDPRRPLARELLTVLERFPSAPILMYTPYEKRVLKELATALPDFADRIDDIIARLVDLCAIIRDNVYHPDFNGSFSIKDVLPALVPELGYDDLEIADGNTASMRYLEMIELAKTDPDPARIIWEQLWAYCKRDTEAMVAVMRVLSSMLHYGPTQTEDY